MQNIAVTAFNKLRNKFISESTQYSGASKMGKGSALKGVEVKADFEKFESYFYTDSVIFGIVNTIADSMSEAGIIFTHTDSDLALQANDVASSFDFDSHIAGLTRSNMVFGNSFSILEETEGYQFLDILNPKSISAQVKNNWHIENIEAVLSDGDSIHLANVFHEIDDKDFMLAEVKRVLSVGGKLVIIDWKKMEMDMGPPVSERLSPEEVILICSKNGFEPEINTEEGPYNYMLVFSVSG